MTRTGFEVFDRAVHAANGWLHELESRMGWDDRRAAWRLLRISLHLVRDRLGADEAAQFAAQMPLLIKGAYWEGWRPSAPREPAGTAAAFLEPLAAAFDEDPGFDAEAAFREVVGVLSFHVAEGELEDVRRALPEAVKPLWEA